MIFNSVVPIVKNVIENVTDLFDLNLNTISGSIETVSNQGGGSEGNGNISVIENDLSLGEFDVNLDFDEVKYTSDFILSGFTDEVTFYDSTSERITMDKELTPLQVTFPSGYIQSLKYNSVIKYDSKTVYLYDWTDGFNFPLIDYTDDGSSATLKMYAIYTEFGKCEMVLLDRVMTDADLPTDFTAFLYIKDVTIPSHVLFEGIISSVLFEQPILSSNGTIGGNEFAVNCSSYIDSRYAWKAFNGTVFSDAYDCWHSNSGHPSWLEWYNPEPLTLSNIKVTNRDNDGAYINNYTLKYSDDGITYIEYITGTSPNQTSLGEWNIPVSGQSHKYWRLISNTSSGSNNSYTAIAQINLTGTIDNVKWYCKEIKYDTAYTDKLPVNIWFNKAYYTQGGKYIESKNSYIIDYESDNENGCLIDYTDDGFGDLALHLYAIEFNDDDNYRLFLSDKTAVQLESYGDISDVEYIDDVVLQSHFNCEYSAQSITPNFDVVGNVTISDGVASGFNSSNYLSTTYKFTPNNDTWELHYKITTPNDINTRQFFAGAYNAVDFQFPAIGIYQGRFLLHIGSTGSGWDIYNGSGNNYISSNTTYLVKLVFNGSSYVLSYYDYNLEQWIIDATANTSTKCVNSTTALFGIGLFNYGDSLTWGGSVDLNECYIKIDDEITWQPYSPGYILKDQFQSFSYLDKDDEPSRFIVVEKEADPSLNSGFTVSGNVIITDGVASNFSSSNYLTANYNFAPSGSWELGFAFTPNSTNRQYFLGTTGHDGFLIGVADNNNMSCWISSTGSGWDIGGLGDSYNILSNSKYYVKLTFNGTNTYTFSISKDDKEHWTNYTGNASQVYGGDPLRFGVAWTSGYPLNGSIDLNETYIKENGVLMWTPYPKGIKTIENTELAPYTRELIPYDVENFNKIGNPTIENEIVTGFNSGNYLTLPELFLPGNNTWEMVFKVNSRTTNYSQLIGSEDDGNGIGIFINGGRFFVSAGIGGWYYDTGLDNGVIANTDYWVKFEFTGSEYILSSSTDGIHYNDSKAVSNSNTLNSTNVVKIGYGSRMSASWDGTIDLSESYIKVDGSYWWRPYTQEYEYNYRGSLVNYADDGSANTIKAYKVEYNDDSVYVVLTNDTDFTVTDMKSKTYLADIVIPEHETYHYGERDFVIDYENPDLSSGGTMGGTEEACQSDSYENSSYYPWYAFNRNSGNQWRSQSVAGNHWITFYTPTSILLDRIDIKNFSDGNYTTFQYKVLVSNDNETWTELKSDVNLNNTGNDVWSISGFTNNTAVKYIRILSTKGFNANQVGFNKIYIYGHYITTGYGWILDDE